MFIVLLQASTGLEYRQPKSRNKTPGALTGVRMTIEGGIVMVGGIILGIACAMYAGAIMDMEDLEAEEENK